EITNGILFFIAKNNLPFDLVESEGFLVLMRKAIPLYKVPSRRTITRLMEERYDGLSTLIKEELVKIHDICLTTDVWTESKNTKSFIALTAHYLINEQHKSVTIGVEELTDRHTADYLRALIAQWNIKKESVVAIISDSAPNIKKAIVDSFGIDKHLPCFEHLLNLVPSKIIENDEIVSPLITKIKNIVKFFKKSVVAADKLRLESDLKLIQSVETRWNSCYEMLKRFVELADKISVILLLMDSAPEMLVATELKIVKEFIQLLEPFYEATQILSKEKHFTGSKTIPVIKIIKNKLNLLTITESGARLKKLLCEEFSKRFENIEQISILASATFLNPRFKKLYFENHLAYSNMLKKLIRMLNSMNESNVHSAREDQTLEISHSFWSYHETVVNYNKTKQFEIQDQNEIPEDLRYYLHQEVIEMKGNPIAFWNHYSQSTLSKFVKRYLTVIATSVPSERLFSRTGNIMVDSRNKLSSLHLQQLLFLNFSLSIA
ncbi:Zinc finger BED domain-containing protein, partial [Ooceraea biroi]